jgi:thiosulfate reductase cytochrome b subunit
LKKIHHKKRAGRVAYNVGPKFKPSTKKKKKKRNTQFFQSWIIVEFEVEENFLSTTPQVHYLASYLFPNKIITFVPLALLSDHVK